MSPRELISLKQNIRHLGNKMHEHEVFCGSVNDFLSKAYRRQSLPLPTPDIRGFKRYQSTS